MCRAVKCRTCGKTTWSGCGSHVDAVLANVPDEQVCDCTPQSRAQAQSERGGLLARLFGA